MLNDLIKNECIIIIIIIYNMLLYKTYNSYTYSTTYMYLNYK